MPFEYDSSGSLVLQEVDGGKKLPVFIHPDGKKAPFDADAALQTISARNAEAKTHREAKEAAERQLAAFSGITDPAEAKKALDLMKNLDAKKLVDAGEFERVKAELLKSADEKYAPFVKEAETLKQQLYAEKIGGAFARSKFIADNVAIPSDMVQAAFGSRFKIEDGRVVSFDAAGNKLFSRVNLGQPAEFEEALEMLIDAYPNKAAILKSSGANGGGAQGGSGGGGGKTMKQAQFDALPPKQRAARMAEGYRIVP